MLGSSSDGEAAAVIMAAGDIASGDDDKYGGELFESGGGGGSGGNRWPRQETIALLQIRSDMDAAFRDSSLKGPLWDEVSRKMAELGYHRSGKKCKEKFENVYKYHKRTKDGRVGKSEGKTYRFFDQLEALEQHQSNPSSAAFPLPPPQPQGPPQAAVPVTMVMPPPGSSTVPSSPQPISVVHVAPPPWVSNQAPPPPPPQQQPHQQNVNNSPMGTNQMGQQVQVQLQQQQAVPGNLSPIQIEHSGPSSDTPSSSSSTSSDEEMVVGRRKRKRKWKDFFERMMKEVIDRQEQLQKSFLEAVEKREHDRVVREEAWKMQEVTRLNQEHEILVQEKSMAAAKDAALISFLKKLSEQQHIPLQLPVQLHSQTQAQPPPPPQPQAVSAPPVVATTKPRTHPQQVQVQLQQPQVHSNPVPVAPPPLPQPQPLTQLPPQQTVIPSQAMVVAHNVDLHKANNGNGGGEIASPLSPSSSRWPKAEVEALINLRKNLDQKYQENGPKGPLWEEISAAMKKLGYNRNPKRCKEKWENINKYFKKVKESNRKRPEDSKTCPYFHQLDALYREKNKGVGENTNSNTNNATNVTSSYGHPSSNLNLGHAQQHWLNPGDPDHEESEEDEEDNDQENGYEIVTNANANASANAGSMSTLSTTTATTTPAE